MRIPDRCPNCKSKKVRGTPEHGFRCESCGFVNLVNVKIKEFTTANEI